MKESPKWKVARAENDNKTDLPGGGGHEEDILWETAWLKEAIRQADVSSTGTSTSVSTVPAVNAKLERLSSFGNQLKRSFERAVDLCDSTKSEKKAAKVNSSSATVANALGCFVFGCIGCRQ